MEMGCTAILTLVRVSVLTSGWPQSGVNRLFRNSLASVNRAPLLAGRLGFRFRNHAPVESIPSSVW